MTKNRGMLIAVCLIATALVPALRAEAHGPARHVHTGVTVCYGCGVGYGYGYGYGYWRGGPVWGYGYGPFFHVRLAPRHGWRPVRQVAPSPPAPTKLFIYPAQGQSAEQMADDRYDCHVWASDRTGFDPTLGGGTQSQVDDYQRAFTACLEGRGYVVK